MAEQFAQRFLEEGERLTDQVCAQTALGLAETRIWNESAALEALRASVGLAPAAEVYLDGTDVAHEGWQGTNEAAVGLGASE